MESIREHRDATRRDALNIALAGSRTLPRKFAYKWVEGILMALPEDSAVIMRRGLSTDINPFENDCYSMCKAMGMHVIWARPNPSKGRASVYTRDLEMVQRSDVVALFVSKQDVEMGYSGTFHLFEKAMDENKPVYAWSVSRDGSPERWGESDDENKYDWLFA